MLLLFKKWWFALSKGAPGAWVTHRNNHVLESKSFLDSGKYFRFLDRRVLDFWKCFWILGRVLDSGTCFVPTSHRTWGPHCGLTSLGIPNLPRAPPSCSAPFIFFQRKALWTRSTAVGAHLRFHLPAASNKKRKAEGGLLSLNTGLSSRGNTH